ncbi:MAG TPA: TOMM precursor leader peptide-binding protein [Kofleriaceae bacterium]|jgi:ribosomal protein S12 methylthiotransferase accessory factor|nr:TOMM precursor leader peptide-binding protein [Kofleriaceae bacterium]
MQIPAFRSDLRVEVTEADGVFLLAEHDVVRLSGALYRVVVPLIDGRRTVDELVERARGRASAAEVHYAIERLAAGHYLVEADGEEPDAAAALWQTLGVEPRRARAAIAATRVRVIAAGDAPVDAVAGALAAAGLAVVDAGPALTIVVTDDYLRDALADHNRAALAAGTPWIAVRPIGRTMWIGPRFVPGTTACWECLAERLRSHRRIDAMIGRRGGAASLLRPARAALPGTALAAAHLLASAVARGAVTGDDGLAGALVTLDTLGLGLERHRVVRRPQCPACGDPGLQAARGQRPIELVARPKRFTAEGGHRAARPEDTVQRWGLHVSAVTGVVRQLEQVHDGDGTAPIFDAGHNLARHGDDLTVLKQAFRSRSGGKGASAVQARASGLCEAIERHSGVFRGDEARRRARIGELGGAAVHPHRWLNFSDRQYDAAATWNAGRRKLSQQVPARFDDRAIDWSPAWSLTDAAVRYLPTALCYYDHPGDGGPAFGWADSSGCAAGNTLEEAILQGFLELVERDSVALWWYQRARRPRVDLDRLDEPYLRRVEAYYASLGRELWVLDVTTDLGIPAFAAVSRRSAGRPEELVVGFGAHLEARLGVLRAVTEMNQFLPYLSGPMAGASVGDREVAAWLEGATLAEQRHLAPADRPPVDPARYPRRWSDDLRDDVMTCVDIARRAGIEVVVLDQTRPDIELPVVRVVAPGLRHFWQRLGPGRLHDVPLALGWIDRPTPEDELNPIAVFF